MTNTRSRRALLNNSRQVRRRLQGLLNGVVLIASPFQRERVRVRVALGSNRQTPSPSSSPLDQGERRPSFSTKPSRLINVVATPLPPSLEPCEGGWDVIHRSERRISERRIAPWLQGVRIYEMASKQRRFWLVAILLLASVLAVPTARAHEARPAYLEIKETSPNKFSVLWRTPVLAGMRLPIVLTMPGDVKDLKEPVKQELADSLLERRWIDAGANGLAGKRIEFPGLQATITDVLVRVEMLDGRKWTTLVRPSQPWFELSAAPSKLHVAGAYLRLGIEHILGGVDHLLFILALMILVKGTRRLIATVTAFTVAHSITLAGATLGFVHVPRQPVEAAIALSIVFVACEIVHAREGRLGWTERWPWIVAFAFGLLHGFGFAGALSEVGLPQTAIPVALLFFNIGVEIGQLLFIAAILSIMALARWLIRRTAIPKPVWAWRVAPYSIGGVAAFWMVQRIAAF
jgi:hydrogenase/urease accessory protein HupE